MVLLAGEVISRSCQSLKIQSCGVLTNAAYCFCDTDLCNSEPITKPTPPDHHKHEHVGDDEDYESSGNESDSWEEEEHTSTTGGQNFTETVEKTASEEHQITDKDLIFEISETPATSGDVRLDHLLPLGIILCSLFFRI